VSGAFEGDLIRPLGLVTLHFGYAEYELDLFLERLASTGAFDTTWRQRPLGQKLSLLKEAVGSLGAEIQAGLAELLDEARELVDRRNSLVHSCILAGGRVVSGRHGIEGRRTSPDELTALADRIFTWKERMHVYRWRQVEPLLAQPGLGD
jgi:hypothetical protein